MTRWIPFLLVVLGLSLGCGEDAEGGGTDAGDPSGDAPPGSNAGTFDEELPSFSTTICDHAVMCIGQDRATCEADLAADMADAKAQLDEAGEQRCARCMDVKTAELGKIVAANCNHTAADANAIFAACDLDKTVDYDGDDNPGNDDKEACAGFP